MTQRLYRLIYYLRNHGLLLTFQILAGKLEDRWFDLYYGTDTVAWVPLSQLAINSKNQQPERKYQPTPSRIFKHVMRQLQFPPGSVFVDMGSGKGKILLMATWYGFKRIVGVEFSPELCTLSKKNAARFIRATRANVDIEVVESDVVDYEIEPDENVFFLFNPFGAEVMAEVLRNLHVSLGKKPRKIWLIYYNPIFAHIIGWDDILRKAAEYTYAENRVSIFTSDGKV